MIEFLLVCILVVVLHIAGFWNWLFKSNNHFVDNRTIGERFLSWLYDCFSETLDFVLALMGFLVGSVLNWFIWGKFVENLPDSQFFGAALLSGLILGVLGLCLATKLCD